LHGTFSFAKKDNAPPGHLSIRVILYVFLETQY
jgi:hypothetical protein